MNTDFKKTDCALCYPRLSVFIRGQTGSGWWAWVDLNHRPHPYQGCALASLSYRPNLCHTEWSWSGSNRRPPGEVTNQALSQLSYSPFFRVGPPFRQPSRFIQSRPVEGRRNHELNPWSFRKNYRTPSGDPERARQIPRKGSWRFGVERLLPTHLTLYTQTLFGFSETPPTFSLRKEVIQPQVLLRLPCYDFTPIMNHTLGRCPRLRVSSGRLLVQSHFRDVTGGVYKARERIPRQRWLDLPLLAIIPSFMQASCSLQSELRPVFCDWLPLAG